MTFRKIVVVGLGYIGLPTAAMFASRKVQVVGVDVNQSIVDTINQGQIHIVEPELDMLVRSAVQDGYLRASTTPETADAFLIAVPTPFKDNYQPDVSYIQSAARMIASVLKKGDLVILESTSPVGTTDQLSQWLSEVRDDLIFPHEDIVSSDINIAYCPERVLPGHVVRELVENDRVIGGITPICTERSAQLYTVFVTGECAKTNARTAEMAKLTENASRDVGIAFANELSLIADRLNIDVWELIELANRHPRVNILHPGPGVGGHCIAVDPWFLVSSAPDECKLIRCARQVNNSKPDWVVSKVRHEMTEFLFENPQQAASDIVIACLGLAFKANIDDLRESPAMLIASKIIAEFPCTVSVVEPNISILPESLTDKTELVGLDIALYAADILVVLVDHNEFKSIAVQQIKGKHIVDTRGIWQNMSLNSVSQHTKNRSARLDAAVLCRSGQSDPQKLMV